MTSPLLHIGVPKTGTTHLQRMFGDDSRIQLVHGRMFNQNLTSEIVRTEKALVYSDENFVVGHFNFQKLYGALRSLHNTFPDGKILITIREQFSMLRSRYKHGIHYIKPISCSFESWLHSPEGLDYINIGCYYDLYRVVNLFFDKENIHIVPFEILQKQPELFVKEVYALIELPQKDSLSFEKTNANKDLKLSYWVIKLNKLRVLKKRNLAGRIERKAVELIAKSILWFGPGKELSLEMNEKTRKTILEMYVEQNRQLVKEFPHLQSYFKDFAYS